MRTFALATHNLTIIALMAIFGADATQALPLPDVVSDLGEEDNPYIKSGYLPVTLYNGWKGHVVDPTGVADSTAALNRAILDGRESGLVTLLLPGTYLVSDTLVGEQRYQEWGCADHFDHPLEGEPNMPWGTGNPMRKAPALVGPAVGPRPVIRLANASPGFGDPVNPKPVIYFYNNGPAYSGYPAWTGKFDCGMSFAVRNLEVVVGSRNAGAIGVQMPSAQRSSLQDVRVDATGGFAGLRGAIQTKAVVNVEVVGGQYGVIFALGSEYAVGLTLRDQTVAALLLEGFSPTTIVGVDIDKAEGPAVLIKGYGQTSQLTIVDGRIRVRGGNSAAVANDVGKASGSSVYLRNVYFAGPAPLIQSGQESPIKPTDGAWSRMLEYSHVDSRSNNGIISRSWIDGTRSQDTRVNVVGASEAPTDLVRRHIWRRLPWFGDSGVKNVRDPDIGARGDGSNDDTAALQRAIDRYSMVFLPRGDYRISAPLTLHSNTRLFGGPGEKSRIYANGWIPTEYVPMLRTDDDPNASTMIGDVHLNMPGGSLDATYLSALEWRAGAGSLLNEFTYRIGWEKETAAHPRRLVKVTGNGGGRWYGTTLTQNWEGRTAHPDHRILMIEQTKQPLTLYGMNSEYVNSPAVEIKAAHNVRILGNKTEVSHPYVLLTDATNVLHAGIAGHCWESKTGVRCSTATVAMALVRGGRNLELANETLYNVNHKILWMVDNGDTGTGIAGNENCSLFKKGEVDDSAFPHCGDGRCDLWSEAQSDCAADCANVSACGNMSCDAGEDCRSCPLDCGACPAPPGALRIRAVSGVEAAP